jgi:heavy metal sensor kinase
MTLRIRTRLTLWYIGVLASVLVVFSVGVLLMQRHYSRVQFDTELESVARTAAGVLRTELAQSHDLARAAAATRLAIDIPDRTVAILDARGQPVAAHWRGFRRANLPRPTANASMVGTLMQNAAPWRIRLQREDSPNGPFIVFVGASERPLIREQLVLGRTLLAGVPLAALLSALICWGVASRALAPLTEMSDQAERITAQSIQTRLSPANEDDEIGQLARAFNRLLDRVREAVDSQRQFMADASHELRTPLTAARTAAEVMLMRPHRDEEEYRDALDIVRTQTHRLRSMVDDMLVLARADAGGARLRMTSCAAGDMLDECADAARVLAGARGITLDSVLEPAVWWYGDEALLRQLTLNLLQNAVAHTPPGGSVRLTLRRVNGHIELAVSDTGCGIAPSDRERIFERFVRLDQARENLGGAGLGLPIARWIAESHGGTLTLDASGPAGSTFIARFPQVAQPLSSTSETHRVHTAAH